MGEETLGSHFDMFSISTRQMQLECARHRRDAVRKVWLKLVAFGLFIGVVHGAITMYLLQRVLVR